MDNNILVINNKERVYRSLENTAIACGLNAEFVYTPNLRGAIELVGDHRVIDAVVTDFRDSSTEHPFPIVLHVLVNAARKKGYVPIIGYTETYDEQTVSIATKQGVDAVVRQYGVKSDWKVIGILAELLENPEQYRGRPLLHKGHPPFLFPRKREIPSRFDPDFHNWMIKSRGRKGTQR